jgi:methionyl-tRNA formyltransferase
MENAPIKIGFFGTPLIAAQCLEYLSRRFDIGFAVSVEDKPQGRNLRLTPTPVHETAARLGIPVLQPRSIKDPDFVRTVASFNADIFVVVAYGKIIPREVFSLPSLGSINLHPSLLPLYRGAAPVEWAIRSGETFSGVTVQRINERLDAGDILMQKRLDIGFNETAGEFFELAISEGCVMLEETIRELVSGAVTPLQQDESRVVYCGKISRETARIAWNESALSIHNLVRAFNPKPFAWSSLREKQVRIITTSIRSEGLPALEPGEIRIFERKRLLSGTGDGTLEILFLQPETKKVMNASSFINGHRLLTGERWDA